MRRPRGKAGFKAILWCSMRFANAARALSVGNFLLLIHGERPKSANYRWNLRTTAFYLGNAACQPLRNAEQAIMFRAVLAARFGKAGTGYGASPSGKAADFESAIRRFESYRPSQ